MRIAHFSHSLECGGSMAMVVNLAVGMAKQGHEIDVILLDEKTGSSHEVIWAKELEASGVRFVFLGRHPGAPGIVSAARLWSLVLRRRYDILHSHLPMPDAIAGFVHRFSLVHFVHVMTVHNLLEPRSSLMARLAAGATVVYCSEAVRSSNERSLAHGTVIPNGIVRERYSRTAMPLLDIRHDLNIPHESSLIVMIGRLCAQKNQAVAIEALPLLAEDQGDCNTHLLLCGEGPNRSNLESLVRRLHLGGRVHFLGNRTDIPQLLLAADAFVSTSIYEGMPLTVLEAMESGIPCVLSSIREHSEIAASVPGCFFASAITPAEVARALRRALHLSAAKQDLAKARRETLREHSMERCIESYIAVYRSALSLRSSPTRGGAVIKEF